MLAGIADGETSAVPGGAEDLLEQRVADTLSRWLAPLDGESSLAIVWEDLHWADRSSLRVLGLLAVLESLQTLDLVRRNESAGVSDRRYKFKHALTQQVAYQSVLVATRRKLHRAAANILASPTEVRTDVLPLIAYRFENLDQPVLAVPWLTKAAEGSARAHAYEAMIASHLRQPGWSPRGPQGAAATRIYRQGRTRRISSREVGHPPTAMVKALGDAFLGNRSKGRAGTRRPD